MMNFQSVTNECLMHLPTTLILTRRMQIQASDFLRSMGMTDEEIDAEANNAGRLAEQGGNSQSSGNEQGNDSAGEEGGGTSRSQDSQSQEARPALELAGQTLADASDSPLEGNGRGLLVTWRNHGKSTES